MFMELIIKQYMVVRTWIVIRKQIRLPHFVIAFDILLIRALPLQVDVAHYVILNHPVWPSHMIKMEKVMETNQ